MWVTRYEWRWTIFGYQLVPVQVFVGYSPFYYGFGARSVTLPA